MSALGRCNNGLGGVMHSPSARALRHLDRYCIVLVRTLKHVSPAKCVITITYYRFYICCYGTSNNVKIVFILTQSTFIARVLTQQFVIARMLFNKRIFPCHQGRSAHALIKHFTSIYSIVQQACNRFHTTCSSIDCKHVESHF